MVVSLATMAAMCAPDQHHATTAPVVYASTTTTGPPNTTTSTTYLGTTTTTTDPTVYAAWTHVSVCENGAPGWNAPRGVAYPDSLGISAHNWSAYGGTDDRSPGAQIAVAQRIQAAAGLAGVVPDQAGCASW